MYWTRDLRRLLRHINVRIEDPFTLMANGRTWLHTAWLTTFYSFAAHGDHLSIHPTVDFWRPTAHRVKLGSYVKLQKDVWINIAAEPKDYGDPVVVIEDGCVIARRSTISARNSIHLEGDVIFGPSVLVMDHSHAYEDPDRPVKHQGITAGGTIRIGQGCWIGQGSAIVCTKGELVLGRNCVVAANSLITRSYPPCSIISGNPARVVKQFDPIKRGWVLGSARTPELQSDNEEAVPCS